MNPPSLLRRTVFTASMLASAGLLITAHPLSAIIMTVGVIAVLPRPVEEQDKVGWPPAAAKWQAVWMMVFWITEIIYHVYFDSVSANGVLVSQLAFIASLVVIVCVTIQSWWHWLLLDNNAPKDAASN